MTNVFAIKSIPGKWFPWSGRMDEDLWRLMRQFIYARDEGYCRYCNETVELFECHIHHTLPLSEGGTNHPSNLKTLCIACHEYRHPFMKSTFERLCGRG